MDLTLILMRHAKSSWDDPAQDDFDRPLNGRGRRSAPAIAEWLVDKGHLPDIVLVSGARRTVETWERMATTMPETATMQSAPALYLAGPETILNVLKSQNAPVVMMIGHNPGFAEFAAEMADTPPDHPKFAQYPTRRRQCSPLRLPLGPMSNRAQEHLRHSPSPATLLPDNHRPQNTSGGPEGQRPSGRSTRRSLGEISGPGSG